MRELELNPGSSRDIVAASAQPGANRGVRLTLPAGSTQATRALRLDDGVWLLRAVRVNDAGDAIASTAVAGAFALVLFEGTGSAQHQEAEIIPLRGKTVVRAFDSCLVTMRGIGTAADTLWSLEARKLTASPVESQAGPGNALAAGAHTIVPPVFSTRVQLVGTAGDTVQWRDAAAAAIGPALALPAVGVLDLDIPLQAFDVVFTTAALGYVEFWRVV